MRTFRRVESPEALGQHTDDDDNDGHYHAAGHVTCYLTHPSSRSDVTGLKQGHVGMIKDGSMDRMVGEGMDDSFDLEMIPMITWNKDIWNDVDIYNDG